MCNALKKNKKGFTLIELIVVIAILGVLAAVLIPQFSGFTSKANDTQIKTDANAFATALDAALIDGSVTAGQTSTNDSGVISKDPVIKLAGIKSTVKTIMYTTGGEFSLTITVGTKDYTATRDSTNAKIEY